MYITVVALRIFSRTIFGIVNRVNLHPKMSIKNSIALATKTIKIHLKARDIFTQ